jgi:hypothetical protein
VELSATGPPILRLSATTTVTGGRFNYHHQGVNDVANAL